MTPREKWGSAYWMDLGERTGATFVGALVTMLTADASGVISGNPQQWWVIVGLPTVLSVLKGLLVNLGGTAPTASAVSVNSTNEGTPPE